MLAVAEAVARLRLLPVERAVEVMGALVLLESAPLEPLIPAVAVVAQEKTQVQQIPAAPASSSSNTTSALPRSSPSSHRRSGLHLRVR